MRESTRQRLTRRIKSAMHSRSRLLTCATADEIRRVLPDFEELFGDATRKTSVVARNVLTLLVIGGGQGLCTPLCAVYSAWLQPAWKLWRRSTMFNMLPNYSEDSARRTHSESRLGLSRSRGSVGTNSRKERPSGQPTS